MYEKWDTVDTVVGVIAGVIASVLSLLGWLSPKFAKLEAELDEVRDAMNTKVEGVHSRVTANAKDIAELRAHHEDDRRRLERIDGKLDNILDRLPYRNWRDGG